MTWAPRSAGKASRRLPPRRSSTRSSRRAAPRSPTTARWRTSPRPPRWSSRPSTRGAGSTSWCTSPASCATGWDAVLAVHLDGMFNVVRAASVSMREQKGGRIISMSSVSALGAPGQPNYAAAKAGIIGLTWSTANAMAKYGVTVNAIMPSGATRMIDSTPRGRAVFEQTGKWPSEQAVGTDRDPDNVAPIVVYLASDGAANVNGQVFHARGYGYTILAQPHAVRHIRHQRRWDPEELTKIFPETLGGNLKHPPSIEFGQKIDERPADEWRDLGDGRRFWKSRYEEP